MLTPRTWLQCFSRAMVNTVNHDGIEHAGYLAFLGLLALFPFLVLVTALAGVLGGGHAGAELLGQLFRQLPPHVANALEPRILEITSGPPQGLLTVAILGAIWTASSAVEGFRTVLNRAYHVSTPPAYWWRRLLSILQLLVFSFIVLVGLFLLVVLPVVWRWVESALPVLMAADAANFVSFYGFALTACVLFVMVANLYYVLPNIRQTLLSVLPGAAITVALWLVAARIFTYYLASFQQVNLIYGSLGGIIAALLFFYIMNVIFIFGAEFNYLLKKAHGDRIIPREGSHPEA